MIQLMYNVRCTCTFRLRSTITITMTNFTFTYLTLSVWQSVNLCGTLQYSLCFIGSSVGNNPLTKETRRGFGEEGFGGVEIKVGVCEGIILCIIHTIKCLLQRTEYKKSFYHALLICAWSLSNIKIHLGQTYLSLRNMYLILRSKYFH